VPKNASEFFEVTKLKPAFGQGFRGALVWVCFLLVGFSTDQLALGIQAGFVGWIVSFCDDAYGLTRRFAGAGVLTLIAGLSTFMAMIASGTILGAVIVTAVLGAGASLAAVAGPAGAKKGLVVMFLALFAVGTPGDYETAKNMAIASLVGGIATMAVMLVMVPIGRSHNPLLAVAKLYRECAILSRQCRDGALDVDISQTRMAFIQNQRETYLDARYSGRRATRKLIEAYLEQDATIVRALVTFQDVRRSENQPLTEKTRKMYAAIADMSEGVARSLESPGLHDVGIGKATAAIDNLLAEIMAQPEYQQVGLAILRHLRRAVVSLLEVENMNAPGPAFRPILGPSPWEKLVANLRYDTPLRRHLFRYVTLMSLATALYKYFDIPDGFFITIGINIMLQPDLGGSVSRLRAYALGTLAGSAVGAVLGVTLDSVPIGLGVATFITLFLMIAFTRVTWWAFAVGASVFIVSALGLLVEGGFYLGIWRFLDTLIAAAFVAFGLFVLWPTRAKAVIPVEISQSLHAVAEYLRLASTGDGDVVTNQRNNVVRQASELGQRVNEYSREPGSSEKTVAQLQTTLIDVLRLYGLITAIAKSDIDSRSEGGGPATDDLSQTRDAVIANLESVAAAFASNSLVPKLADIPPLPAQSDHLVVGRELVAIGLIAQSLSGRIPVA